MTAFDNQENKTTSTFTGQVVGFAQPRGELVSPTISCTQLNGKFWPHSYAVFRLMTYLLDAIVYFLSVVPLLKSSTRACN
jgi:hypothetical protein